MPKKYIVESIRRSAKSWYKFTPEKVWESVHDTEQEARGFLAQLSRLDSPTVLRLICWETDSPRNLEVHGYATRNCADGARETVLYQIARPHATDLLSGRHLKGAWREMAGKMSDCDELMSSSLRELEDENAQS